MDYSRVFKTVKDLRPDASRRCLDFVTKRLAQVYAEHDNVITGDFIILMNNYVDIYNKFERQMNRVPRTTRVVAIPISEHMTLNGKHNGKCADWGAFEKALAECLSKSDKVLEHTTDTSWEELIESVSEAINFDEIWGNTANEVEKPRDERKGACKENGACSSCGGATACGGSCNIHKEAACDGACKSTRVYKEEPRRQDIKPEFSDYLQEIREMHEKLDDIESEVFFEKLSAGQKKEWISELQDMRRLIDYLMDDCISQM